jgi:hypothetical protein
MKELESLKAIAESQLIELHNSLRDEREQKHIYKQQLDHRIQQVFKTKKNFFLSFHFFYSRNLFEIWTHYV